MKKIVDKQIDELKRKYIERKPTPAAKYMTFEQLVRLIQAIEAEHEEQAND